MPATGYMKVYYLVRYPSSEFFEVPTLDISVETYLIDELNPAHRSLRTHQFGPCHPGVISKTVQPAVIMIRLLMLHNYAYVGII